MDIIDAFDLENGENPKILTYGLEDEEVELLEDYMIHFDIQDIIILDNFLLEHKMQEIIEGEGIEQVDRLSIEGKFVFFYDCAEGTIDAFLNEFEETELDRPLFAAINEETLTWSVREILETILLESESEDLFEDDSEEDYEEDSYENAYGFVIKDSDEDDYL